MKKFLSLSACLAIASLGTNSPLFAQERSAVSSAELRAAAVQKPVTRAETVRELLSSDQARKLAGSMGVSAEELSDRVEALDGADLDRLAEQAGVTESMSMRRRANVVISTTAIIIILLVLILLTE